jgi:hypothetical protein
MRIAGAASVVITPKAKPPEIKAALFFLFYSGVAKQLGIEASS